MALQTSISEYFGARKRGAPSDDLKKVTPSNKVLILDKNSVTGPGKLGQAPEVDSPARSIIYKESPPSSAPRVSSAPKRSRKTPLVASRRSSATKQKIDPNQPDIRKCLFPGKSITTEGCQKQAEKPASATSLVETPATPVKTENSETIEALSTPVKTEKLETTEALSTPVKTENSETTVSVAPVLSLTPKKEDKVDEESQEVPSTSKKEVIITAQRAESLQKSAKLADLKNRLKRLNDGFSKHKEIRERNANLASPPNTKNSNEGFSKLREIRERREKLTSSPKIKEFRTIELEVNVSPKKKTDVVDELKTANSPSLLRKALFMSPTKLPPGTAPYVSPRKLFEKPPPSSPTKPAYQRSYDLAIAGKPALPLPYKYRCLAETFRSVDTVVSMMYNRNENIVFNKLKLSVQQLSKRNLTESHIGQIMAVLPDAFVLKREKIRAFGNQKEDYELVLLPVISDETPNTNTEKGNKEKTLMSPNVLLKRRREFYNGLLEKAKDHHEIFLRSLDPPIIIARDKLTRWHPDFDVDSSCADILPAPLPLPPAEKLSTAKDVLSKVKDMFSTNNRMERVLESMSNKQSAPPKSETATATAALSKALKGIPKSLLEKVRAKQAAKTAALLTRCPEETKRRLELTRLPELARILRNIFILERKNVLPQAVVIEKVNQSFREVLSQDDMIRHFSLLMESVPGWITEIMDGDKKYLRVARDADFTRVTTRLKQLIDHNQVNL